MKLAYNKIYINMMVYKMYYNLISLKGRDMQINKSVDVLKWNRIKYIYVLQRIQKKKLNKKR